MSEPLLFSSRHRLGERVEFLMEEKGMKNCALNVITILDQMELLDRTEIRKLNPDMVTKFEQELA